MADIGTRYTDSRQRAIEQRMHAIYRAAQAEIIEQLDAHTKRQNAQTRVKLAQVKAGKLSEEEFNKWQAGQMFTGKQWKDKVTSIATTLLTANQQANSIIEGEKRAVFGENATYQSYRLEHDANLDMSFGVYDSATVTRILRDDPTLLKPREIDEEKDIEWNRRNVTHAVAQGIIQGDSIQQIAKRIAKNTASKNEAAMTRYARTAMTSAQNAGRMEVMQEASEMGIQVRKLWIATLDERTRDAHQELDGQTAEINEPFDSMLGPIDYPGDPKADDANIWNCRCTLGYEYKEYPREKSSRLAYAEYYDDEGEYHRESYTLGNVSYNVWKLIKDRNNQRMRSPIANDENGSNADISNISTLLIYGEASEWAKDNLKYDLEELKEGWSSVPSQVKAIEEFEKEIPEYMKTAKEALEKYDFATRTDSEAIANILKDGRFKTQIETGASNGYKDVKMRENATNQLFAYGEKLDVKKEQYEVYGYLDNASRAKMYGGCRVVFNKKELYDRTTFTFGDSLEMIQTGVDPMASYANNPQIFSYGTKIFSHSVPNAPSRLDEIRGMFGALKETGTLGLGNYVELQFHGGVTTNDISYIEVPKKSVNAEEIKELAAERGVKILWK